MQHVLDQLIGGQRLLRETLASVLKGGDNGTATSDATTRVIPVDLCDTTVSIAVQRVGEGGLTYINLHQNEQTSVRAARGVLDRQPGILIELRAQGRRYVTFWNGLRPCVFDPNRMFTDHGLRRALSRYASLSEASFGAVARLRDTVLTLLASPAARGPVVALHNNAGGSYDIHAYASGGSHVGDASRTAISAQCRSGNFFLVTDAGLFERLAAQDFNVVLQHANAADDGSLAVWFQRQGRSYVNVEAGYDQLREQQRMLDALARLDI